MWWTRLRAACWCMLMYAAARKPSPPKGRNFPLWWRRGETGHRHSLHCSVHQHQTAIRMPFPVELGQSADVGPPSIHQSPYEKLDLWPLWQKGQWSGPWLFQCFLPSRRPLRFHFVRGNTWGERSNVGSACSFWLKLGFILRPNGSSSCLFTGRDKANKVSYECLDQFATMVMAHSHVRQPQCLLIKWRPHWMLIVKSCTSAQDGGRGSRGGGCWLLQEPQWMDTMLERCKHYWNNRCSTTSDVLQSFTFSFERVPSLCRPWKSSLNSTTP